MPTLFTALQFHAEQQKRRVSQVSSIGGSRFPGNQVSGIGGQFAEMVSEPIPRRRRSKEPSPRLSLKDRFRVVGKPSSGLHVIVIGAGFAGLSAAYELQSVGYRVTVLEAQPEVGGRVETRRDIVPRKVMEGGAELIGLNHLAWWSYKHKFGLHLDRLSDSGNPPVILGGKRLDPETAAKLGREMNRAQTLIARAAKRVNADEPWRTPRAKSLDRRSLVSGLKSIQMSDMCRLAFVEQLQADNGVDARRQSWLGNLAMIKGGGMGKFWTETETHHCREGNQQLAFEFKAKLKKLELGKPVRGIEIDGKGVTVTPKRGKPVRGTDVVLAIPPTIWSDIIFDPPLPKAYRVQFGKNVKYLLNVQDNCWSPNGPNMSSDGPIDLTWKGTDGMSGSRTGFVAFSGATDAVTCSGWRNRAKKYLTELTPIYPKLKKTSRNGVFMNWPSKRWTRGSYSFPEPGEVTRVGPLLRSGFKQRVHFAGEHTCYAFTGYMEGALQSGLRVAEQLARRDRVIT